MKKQLCRRDQKYPLLLLAVARLVNSGVLPMTELARQYGGTEKEVKDILLTAKLEREQYVEAYKEGING